MTFSLWRTAVVSALSIAMPLTAFVAPVSAAPASPERIIGGTVASITDVPWQVGLLYADSGSTLYQAQICGGSLLNESWVITAAHCVYDEESRTRAVSADSLMILAGVDNLDQPRGTGEVAISKIIVAPGYDGGVNDIALIKLATPVDVSNPDIEPITLPLALDGDNAPANGTDVLVSGWGEYVGYEMGMYPEDLYKATLDVLADSPDDDCGLYEPSRWNYRYEICIGVDGGGRDTCQGDSGGPYAALGLDGDGDGIIEPTLIGVTSWGDGCASAGYPGFATRVSAYVDWIIPIAPQVRTSYSARSRTHTVRWTRLSNQSLATPLRGYRIEFSLDDGETWTAAKTVSSKTKSYSKRGPAGTIWRVSAVSDVNKNLGPYLWANSSGPLQERGIDVPDAPSNFAVTATSPGYIDFEFDEPVSLHGSAIWEYRVYRNRGSKRPQLMARNTNGYATATVNTRIPGTNRHYPLSDYWVVAVNNKGVSAPSNRVAAASDD